MADTTPIALAVGAAILLLIGWVSGAVSPQGLARTNNWLARFGQKMGALSSAGVAALALLALVWLALFILTIMATFGGVLALQQDPSTGGLGLGAVLVGLLGAPFLVWNTVIKQTTLNFQKEGHITDRISKAVEQLGAEKTVKVPKEDGTGSMERTVPNIEVRIGGLLSLERIAQDSTRYDNGRDHVRVMEILCAYVRENAPASGAKQSPRARLQELRESNGNRPGMSDEQIANIHGFPFVDEANSASTLRDWVKALPPLRADVAQALEVLGRRDAKQRLTEARWGKDADPAALWVFDRPPPTLPEANFEAALSQTAIDSYTRELAEWLAHIESYRGYRADLRKTNLQGADLSGLCLSGAVLEGARTEGAKFHHTRLEGANLSRARMEGAELSAVRMQGTNLVLAELQGATLYLSKMEGAKLFNAVMDDANVSYTNLVMADLSFAQLAGVSVQSTRVEKADLSWATMPDANITMLMMDTGTNVKQLVLARAGLRATDISNVAFTKRQIADVFGDASVILPGSVGPENPNWPSVWPRWVLPDFLDAADGITNFADELLSWRSDRGAYTPPPPP
jgi:hypothetical protein